MHLKEKIPSYLLGKTQLTTTVVFSVLFAIFVLLATTFYDNNGWFQFGPTVLFNYTALFILLSIIIIAVSKRLMYRSRLLFTLNWGQYIIWNLAEIVIIALVYTAMTIHICSLGLIEMPTKSFWPIFFCSFVILFFSLGIPYIMAALYFEVQDKNNTIRLMNYGNVITDAEPGPTDLEKITLFGDDGLLKLSISLKNLYYIESDDNYIKVWYSDSNGDVKQYMLRCRLKTVEESFAGSPLVRCHRKYIVNLTRVLVLTREKDGNCLKLDLPSSEPIPISKTYENSVISRFNSR